MDTRTGRIFDDAAVESMKDAVAAGRANRRQKEILKHLQRMDSQPTVIQMHREPPRVGKYDPCPCASGKKFKFCCFAIGKGDVK